MNTEDHAFASGRAYPEPRGKWAPHDPFVRMAEKAYAAYRIRRNWREFRRHAMIGEGVRLGIGARLINHNPPAAVRIGDNVVCRGIIRVEAGGELEIGEQVYIGDGVIISVARRVQIGDGTLIAHGAQVFDNTSHSLDWKERRAHFSMLLGLTERHDISFPSDPVTIGRDCWLGMNSLVMKGVTVGDRSVIGGGAIVTGDVPPDTLAVGPAAKQMIDLRPSSADVGTVRADSSNP